MSAIDNMMREHNRRERKRKIVAGIFAVIVVLVAIGLIFVMLRASDNIEAGATAEKKKTEIPAYTGEPYTVLNNNIPDFWENDITTEPFEYYSNLDLLGRCGYAYACLGEETMPTEQRGAIGMVKPSGWQTVRYDDLIEDRYLYNRCHLIAYMLSGENDNEKNLITGTRYLNIEGMLPFETEVANYIRATGCHVMYRVTPVFEGMNLVATGVEMEALSVEDQGMGVRFHVFVHNVQPGITIYYRTGDSKRAE